MNTSLPALLDVQRALCRSVVARDDGEVRAYAVAGGIDPARRLAIYRNNFSAVLTNALRRSYPAVHRLVGDDCFDGTARAFIEDQPPQRANLDDYGAGFAEFLAQFPPVAALGYLPEVARIEWAVVHALHAPDAVPLDLARLAALTSDEQARVRFAPHPSAAMLHAVHPADAIWRAVLMQDEAALAAVDPASGAVWLLVHRAESGVDVRRLSEDAWRFTAALFAGRPLHAALEEAPCADAQAVLAEHLAAGRLVEFDRAVSAGA